MRFDDGRIAVLDSIEQFSWYLEQNQNPDVKRSKELRLALRSLNGLKVQWEYEHRVVSGNTFAKNSNPTTISPRTTCLVFVYVVVFPGGRMRIGSRCFVAAPSNSANAVTSFIRVSNSLVALT